MSTKLIDVNDVANARNRNKTQRASQFSEIAKNRMKFVKFKGVVDCDFTF